MRLLLFIFPSLLFCAVGAAQPNASHGLDFDTPVTVWDEALPLGNGVLGALVWGDGKPVKISLDRTDLWDTRPIPEFHSKDYNYKTMQAWELEGRYDELVALYETPYNRPGPTKIPAGRIELRFEKDTLFTNTNLDIARARGSIFFTGERRVEVYIHATEAVGIIEVFGSNPVIPHLIAPAFGGKEAGPAKPSIVAGELSQLGYPPPEKSSGRNWYAYTQQGWDGFNFAVYFAWTPYPDLGARFITKKWTGAWSVASSFEGDNPLDIARARVEKVLDGKQDEFLSSHETWWNSYWAQSSVTVPNKVVEREWYLDTYKFGAASRLGAPPITLQGPWTADDGKLPPWKGDYHHDLNTQLSYWPCYSGNRLEGGQNYLDWLWDTREACRDWTQRFFQLPGLNVPMTADLNNNQIGGWRMYTQSATTAAWLSHHFYLHWRYSMDREFLEQRAYPYLRECAVFLEAVTEARVEGKRSLPLTSSPEINSNRPTAWFKTITNYDLALIRWLFTATAELADELGETDDATHWRKVLAECPELSLGQQGKLLVAKDEPLKDSHRHFSHLMAIHPLGIIDHFNGEHDREIIEASLNDLERLGTKQWTGYSFSWLANIAARAKDGEKAEESLEIFASAFVLRNSFHCNGDQSGKGYSNFKYRPFTLEGNFAYAAGLQEMLLQSHTGVIEIFPAIPQDWKDVSFTKLRAQGAFIVTATLKDSSLESLSITAEKGGKCTVQSPFLKKVIKLDMKQGETRKLR